MRRLLVPILVATALLVLVAGAWADSQPTPRPPAPLLIDEPPSVWIGDEIVVTDLEPVSPLAAPAADTCAAASPLELSFSKTADGSGTLTNLYTEEATDPSLSCMFSTPTSPTGYRTAWHALTAGDTGLVTVTTEGTDYDTVLAVFDGTCDALRPIACSDDTIGFQSKVTFRVVRGRTYYIEVADYKPGTPAAATLLLSAVMPEGGGRWYQISNLPFGGVTRHAFVNDGVDMYIIGGQTRVQGVPVITNKLLLYNVVLDRWTEMADVPGSSLSNTTAARLGKRIYVPGGFNGNTTNYVNIHLVYDITTNFWDRAATIPTGLLPNGKMFAWAAAASGPGETSYFLTGGLASYPALDPDAVVLNNTFRYTPSIDQWEAFRPMTTARYAHTAAWVAKGNRGLCVAGGLSSGEDDAGEPIIVLLSDGECYNPAAGVGWQPTGPLNFPRYNAGSAIGPDGSWYIFGGMDASGGVPETEVYDPLSNTWRVLGGEFSLGGRPNSPAREWPRGAFWGDTLYIFGGNTPREQRVISAVERMTMALGDLPLAHQVLLPFASVLGGDNLLGYAVPLPLQYPVRGNFVGSNQFYNPYLFEWTSFGRVTVRLGNIPADSNFNISVYDAYKTLVGQGNTALYGGEKVVSLTLQPGRYYVVVERLYPKDLPDPSDFYSLIVYPGNP